MDMQGGTGMLEGGINRDKGTNGRAQCHPSIFHGFGCGVVVIVVVKNMTM